MNSTTAITPDTTPNVDLYIAMGRARLATREELARLEAERQAQEQREAMLEEWKPLLTCIEQSLPSEFASYLVEPTEAPEGQPLVLDLSALGLGPLGAYRHRSKEEGVGWAPPRVDVDEHTGRKSLCAPVVSHYLIDSATYTFTEALALAEDAAQEVAEHNAHLLQVQPTDLYAPLAGKGGGCYPVLRVGTNRDEVVADGAEDAARFGSSYGADGWLASMAVHTFTFPGAPVAGGAIYAYLALVPVAAEKWADLCGGE